MDAPPPNWMPLLQNDLGSTTSPPRTIEKFVTQEQTLNTVQTVFIGLALMVAAALLAILFIWSYEKGVELFITVFSLLVLAYAVKVVILIYMIRAQLSPVVFQLYLASASAMGLISIFIMLTFSMKYYRRSPAVQQGYQ
jgi:hypothetical protein